MKKLVVVLGLAIMSVSCESTPANDTYCRTEALKITKQANAIRDDIEAGRGNLKVHLIRLNELTEQAQELAIKCN